MHLIIEGVECTVPKAYLKYSRAKAFAVRDLVVSLKKATKNNPGLRVNVIRVTKGRLAYTTVYSWSV